MIFIHPHLEVRKSKIHGRGVFCTNDILSGEVIEKCHYTILEKNIIDSVLRRYAFPYPKNGNKTSVVWGYGSIYNHSLNPNIEYYYEGDLLVFKSLRRISTYCVSGWRSSQVLTSSWNALVRFSSLCRVKSSTSTRFVMIPPALYRLILVRAMLKITATPLT